MRASTLASSAEYVNIVVVGDCLQQQVGFLKIIQFSNRRKSRFVGTRTAAWPILICRWMRSWQRAQLYVFASVLTPITRHIYIQSEFIILIPQQQSTLYHCRVYIVEGNNGVECCVTPALSLQQAELVPIPGWIPTKNHRSVS